MASIVLATINAKWIHPSLAIRLLKANLGPLQDQCEIIEFALRQDQNEKIQALLEAAPKILGLSVSVWNHRATLELLGALEQEWAQGRPIIVLGGPELLSLPPEAEIFSFADYVIRGEGEESFRRLCLEILDPGHKDTDPAPARTAPAGMPAEGRAGPRFIQGETPKLDALVSPYGLYSPGDLAKKLVYVESARGCPYGCEFCQGPGALRDFPLEPFLEDMRALIDQGGRTFKFLDRSFNLDIDRAISIMEFFLDQIRSQQERGEEPLCVHFEMVPFRFPPALREALKKFPPQTLRLELGYQTLNRETARLAGLPSPRDPEEDLAHLKFLQRETQAIIHADLIAGLPGEDLTSFGAGLDRFWAIVSEPRGGSLAAGSPAAESPKADSPRAESPHNEIQVGILKGLPGRPILEKSGAFRMRYQTQPPYEVIETGALPAPQMERIKNFARFWELLINRRPFPELLDTLFPPGQEIFKPFMETADRLYGHFGRNWGIDRKELKGFLESLLH